MCCKLRKHHNVQVLYFMCYILHQLYIESVCPKKHLLCLCRLLRQCGVMKLRGGRSSFVMVKNGQVTGSGLQQAANWMSIKTPYSQTSRRTSQFRLTIPWHSLVEEYVLSVSVRGRHCRPVNEILFKTLFFICILYMTLGV